MNFFLLNSRKRHAAVNMALDETLLEKISHIGKPVLRFYTWTRPAATFGYFQKFSEVERATHLRPLIRRPTGGGIVPHDADWTYSFVAPPNHEWYSLAAIESYHRIHEWIRDAFAKLKIETELAREKKSAIAHRQSAMVNACFSGHEKFDLLWRGKKIAGAAQRRNKMGLLIQGSVQPPQISFSRRDWETAMCEVAESNWKIAWSKFPSKENFVARAKQLALEKYALANYNQKR